MIIGKFEGVVKGIRKRKDWTVTPEKEYVVNSIEFDLGNKESLSMEIPGELVIDTKVRMTIERQ